MIRVQPSPEIRKVHHEESHLFFLPPSDEYGRRDPKTLLTNQKVLYFIRWVQIMRRKDYLLLAARPGFRGTLFLRNGMFCTCIWAHKLQDFKKKGRVQANEEQA